MMRIYEIDEGRITLGVAVTSVQRRKLRPADGDDAAGYMAVRRDDR